MGFLKTNEGKLFLAQTAINAVVAGVTAGFNTWKEINAGRLANVNKLVETERRLVDILGYGGDLGEATTLMLISDYRFQKVVVDYERELRGWKKAIPSQLVEAMDAYSEQIEELLASKECIEYIQERQKKSVFSRFMQALGNFVSGLFSWKKEN